jgi:hypothetical protein
MSQDKPGSNIVARWSAEETAAFFATGERLPRARFEDPEVQARQDRQREALRAALRPSVTALGSALHRDSAETEKRLYALLEAALAGDAAAVRQFIAMYGELLAQALAP